MSSENLPALNQVEQERLSNEIHLLRLELEIAQNKTRELEGHLRSQLSDLILEAQELHILYKAIKKAKKEKRLEQKKRGKNYREPTGLKITDKAKQNTLSKEDQQEKKRLYREAMLQVHPDKFSMNDADTATATEITSRLIEIYKTESLETLRAYHAHIFQGNTGISLASTATEVKVLAKAEGPALNGLDYLLLEKAKLEEALKQAKNQHLYKVVTEYENPLNFTDELRAYYEDRIAKLKKRTRKGL